MKVFSVFLNMKARVGIVQPMVFNLGISTNKLTR